MKRVLIFIILMFSLSACRSVGQKYVTVENDKDCCDMKIAVGNSEEKIQISVSDKIKISYTSSTDAAKNLKFIDVKLFIDGNEILPDGEEYEAAFFDAFRPQKYTLIDKKDCCENLDKKLNFDKNRDKDASLFGVNISKNYEIMKNLPPNIEVLLIAITDKGTQEKCWKLKLTNYEIISDPIRFH